MVRQRREAREVEGGKGVDIGGVCSDIRFGSAVFTISMRVWRRRMDDDLRRNVFVWENTNVCV